jgi:hypothetical protein
MPPFSTGKKEGIVLRRDLAQPAKAFAMSSQPIKIYADRPYGPPVGMTQEAYRHWQSRIEALRLTEDPHEASTSFLRCCEFLQKLANAQMISQAEHQNMRAQLNDIWVMTVERLEQVGSTTPRCSNPSI